MGYTAAVQDIAVVLLNRADAATSLSVSWDELGEYTRSSKRNWPLSWNANVADFERQADGANGKVTKLMPCVKQALLQGSVCVCVTLCIARTCRTQLEASLLRLIATTFHLFGSRSSSELAVAVLLSVGCDTSSSFDRPINLINALRPWFAHNSPHSLGGALHRYSGEGLIFVKVHNAVECAWAHSSLFVVFRVNIYVAATHA